MEESNRRTRRTMQPAGRGAAELDRFRRAVLPADLARLLAAGRGADYWEGLLVGCVYAPRVARLIEFAASNDGPPRWRRLELRYPRRHVVIGGGACQLAPADFAFYAFMVRRRLDARGFVTWNTEGLAGDYLCEYRRLADPLDGNRERVEARLERYGVERQWFEERKCKVNRAVRQLGGWTGCDYRIVSRGARPNTRSGVIVDPGCIRIHDEPSGDAAGAAAAGRRSAKRRAARARPPPAVGSPPPRRHRHRNGPPPPPSSTPSAARCQAPATSDIGTGHLPHLPAGSRTPGRSRPAGRVIVDFSGAPEPRPRPSSSTAPLGAQ